MGAPTILLQGLKQIPQVDDILRLSNPFLLDGKLPSPQPFLPRTFHPQQYPDLFCSYLFLFFTFYVSLPFPHFLRPSLNKYQITHFEYRTHYVQQFPL